ncbi:MAG: hypothetical protein JSR80_04950 [Verrucomicrobia bacterium]|nr:hypothetical protein [Verrucomicrobiota bacterium]
MRTLVLIAVALTSSLFAYAPTAQESPEHIAVLKDQIVLIEDGLFVAHNGQLFQASALFHTDTGFIAEVTGEAICFQGRRDPKDICRGCKRPRNKGHCTTVGCPFYKLD